MDERFLELCRIFEEMDTERLLLLVLVLVQVTNAGIFESMSQAQVDPSANQVQAVEVRDVGMRNGETYAAAYSLYHLPLDLYDLALPLISSHRTRTRTRTQSFLPPR
jgi:hypothetical protein